MNLQYALKLSLIIYFPIKYLTWCFHFYWCLYIFKKHFKKGRGEGDRKQPRNFKHKGKHKIGCYSKYLLIFTAYQVQGWWTMIIIPVESQPDGSNGTEILLKSSWHTHLKHYNPYIFILQKVKEPPYGFSTHIFFASAIILRFGGLF